MLLHTVNEDTHTPATLHISLKEINHCCSGLVSQCCDVVLVRAHLARENPRGSEFRNGEGTGGDGSGEISLRATWDQGGQDPITARRVPSK
jgi:hypothetical protein